MTQPGVFRDKVIIELKETHYLWQKKYLVKKLYIYINYFLINLCIKYKHIYIYMAIGE